MNRNTLFFMLLAILMLNCQREDLSSLEIESPPVATKATYYDDTPLQYSGNGAWFGYFGGVMIWFYGASPQQIQNGMRSTWEMIAPPNDPEAYYRNGVTSWGGARTGFHLTKIYLGEGTVEQHLKKVVKNNDGSYSLISNITYVSASSGSITYNGKVVLDEDCMPRIVAYDSDMPSGCMEDDDIVIIPY